MNNSLAIRYIASTSEQHRISFMHTWLSGTGLQFDRIEGIRVPNYENLTCYDRNKRLQRFGYDLSTSEIGCFLAHRSCWSEAQRYNRPTLILESDIGICGAVDLSGILDQLMEKVDHFDMVRLHGIFEHNELLRREVVSLNDEFYRLVQCLGDPMGAGAYLVTPFAASVLLQKSKTFYQPLDVFLGATWLHGLRFRTIKPYPLKAHDFRSEIGERKRPKQSVSQRLSIEGHRFVDDLKRIVYMPVDFFR